MGKALRPSLISPKANALRQRSRRRRSILYGKGIAHRGGNAKEWPKKLPVANHNGNAQSVDESSLPAKARSDTDALYPKRASEKSRERKGKGKASAPQKPDKQAPNALIAPSTTTTITPSATTPSQGQNTWAKKTSKKMKPSTPTRGLIESIEEQGDKS